MADDLKPSEFTHTLTKIAVSQICNSFGFKGAQSSALDSLTRIATLYLRSLASSAASSSALSGRPTHCTLNLHDVVSALHDLRHPHGFPGAADVTRPLVTSPVLTELKDFLESVDEVPFPRRVPRWWERDSGSVLFEGGVRRGGGEVPAWLPGFPGLDHGAKPDSRRERYWEEEKEMRGDDEPLSVPTVGVGDRKSKWMVQGRRARVKFKIGVRRDQRARVDGLELRNGVCKGGKRVCLVKRVPQFGEEVSKG